MSGNFLIDYGPVAGAFATVIIAYLTLRSVHLAKRQMSHMEREAALDRLPHLFFKDMCLVPVTGSDAAFPKLRIDTKGVANLGRFAATVYSVLLLDKEGRQLASAWPLRIVEAGTACTDFGRGPNEVLAVSRESGGMTSDDPHPKLAVPLAQLADLAASVQLEFAYGGDPTRHWMVELPRFRPDWARAQRLYFDSTNAHTSMTRLRARVPPSAS